MVVKGMKRIFVYGFILACLTLGAGVIGAWSLLQGTQNSASEGQKGDLELSMTVDKTVIFAGEDIGFVFILKNNGDENVSFWIGPPFFDAYLYDSNNVLVAKWTDGRAFPPYIEKITLKPGENFSKTIQWNLYSYNQETEGFIPVKPGQYRISGVWLGEPHIETSKIGITVKGTNRLAVIEDEEGNRIAVEPLSDEVWSKLVELFHSGEMMWIGGKVEVFINIQPDEYYRWGFRFKPETITVAEVTAEGLQATIQDISENLDYWLDIGQAYVFAKVTDYFMGNELQVFVQLSSDIITLGENVTISAIVKDDDGNSLEGATVTATIGDLEILFILSDYGNGNYQGTINTSIVNEGTYKIVVTAQKEGYKPDQTSLKLTVTTNTLCTIVIEFLKTTDVPNGVWDDTIEIKEIYDHKLGGKVLVVKYITATGGHPDFFLDAPEHHYAVITLNMEGEILSAFCVWANFHGSRIWDLINQRWI